jgi:hypothetical protein
VKVRWTGEPRALADPQIEVTKGDVIDVPAATAKSLVEQELAEKVDTKKEND